MIPTLRTIDSSLGFVRDGYLFGTRRFSKVKSDAFRTRLAGRRVVYARGVDATRFFYEGGRFSRVGAVPSSVAHLLQDEGSVQTLEGRAHAVRKHLFVETVGLEGSRQLLDAFDAEWRSAAERWMQSSGPIVLHDEFVAMLTLAAFRWSGIPEELWWPRLSALRDELAGMIDRSASLGPVNWRARARRRDTEAWAVATISAVRSGSVPVPVDSPVDRLVTHRDDDGDLLSDEVAAVELLNLLRPIVAVARFLEFTVLALYRHPYYADAFRRNHLDDVPGFAQEVRRFYPFFPVIAGRATRRLEWDDTVFEPGDRMVLDLYATNHDPATWEQPRLFDPKRFRHPLEERNAMVPQGGGRYAEDHRCPGEPATQELIEHALYHLAKLDYDLPPQSLRISLRTIPATVESGMLVSNVTGDAL